MMDLTSTLQFKPLLQDFWREWFSAYPGREVFQDGNRVFINNSTAFLEYVEHCKRRRAPCWMTVQPFRKRNDVSTVEKLYFDFDSENDLPKAWRETIAFAKNIKQYYNAEPLICFSGNKGYNVYVWLTKPVQFSSEHQVLAKRFYRTAQNMILKGLKFETLDHNVIGDIKRFSRVPYSIHPKTDNPCIPISLNHMPLLVLQLTGYKHHGLNETFIKSCLKQMKIKSDFKRLKVFHGNLKEVRPCIKMALNKSLEGPNGHGMRLAIATEFLHADYKPEDIAALFQNQPDYSFEKSLFYVKDVAKRGYKPFKCKTIQNFGFCLGEKCPFFKKSGPQTSKCGKKGLPLRQLTSYFQSVRKRLKHSVGSVAPSPKLQPRVELKKLKR